MRVVFAGILIHSSDCERKHNMATTGNANRMPKNKIRAALATAAVVVTLFGAQTLAFSEKAQASTQAVQQQATRVVNTTTTSQSQPAVAATVVPTVVPTTST